MPRDISQKVKGLHTVSTRFAVRGFEKQGIGKCSVRGFGWFE